MPSRSRRWPWWCLAGVLLAVAVGIGGAWWHAHNPPRTLARALSAVEEKRFDDVRRELQRLGDAPQNELPRHFLRGALLLHEGRLYPALDEFGHTVNDPQLRVRTLVLSGQALYHLRNFQAAIGLLIQAANAAPDDVEAHRWLAAAYYDLGLHNDALPHLLRVAALDAADPRPHRLIGLIQKDFESYPRAIDSYRESLRRSAHQPDGDAIRQELAECQLKLRQYQEALDTLADCRPGPERWALEAEGCQGAGRLDEARSLLDRTLQATPANLRALLLRGTLALEDGDADAAVQALAQAAAAYPKDYTVRFKLERALRRRGDREQADEQARIAEELKQLRLRFAKLHETAAAEPGSADVRCQLGILAGQLDRPDLARVWFQAALAIDPRHAETLRQVTGEKRKDQEIPSPNLSP
jgi:tetratricopeptide (TPR) repeat protein